MLSTAVETLGFAMLAVGAALKFGPWAGLLVAGAALILLANFATARPKKGVRKIRIPSGALTNETVDVVAPEAPLTNGAVDRV